MSKNMSLCKKIHSFFSKGDKDKVSIIIPIYNSEKWLNSLFNSLINQTYKNIEIIIVIDGSTDNSYDICKSFSEKYDYIKVYTQENKGPGVARNLAFSNTTGNYIMYVDSDDYLESNAVEIALREIKRRKLDILNFNAVCVYDDIKEENTELKNDRYMKKHDYNEVFSGIDYFKTLRRNGDFSSVVWSYIFKKSLIEKNNIKFNLTPFHGDVLFSFECLFYARKAGFISDVLYNRRVRIGSIMTQRNNIKDAYSYYDVINSLEERYSKYNDGDINSFISDVKNSLRVSLDRIKASDIDDNKEICDKEFMDYLKENVNK